MCVTHALFSYVFTPFFSPFCVQPTLDPTIHTGFGFGKVSHAGFRPATIFTFFLYFYCITRVLLCRLSIGSPADPRTAFINKRFISISLLFPVSHSIRFSPPRLRSGPFRRDNCSLGSPGSLWRLNIGASTDFPSHG